MTAIKYNTREEAIAAVKFSIAKRREWMARVEREWAEEDDLSIISDGQKV